MVQSRINTTVTYNEMKTMYDDDVDYSSNLYTIYIDHMQIAVDIALGKQKFLYANKDIVFLPIYIIHDERVIMQIGVFEFHVDKLANILDENDEVIFEEVQKSKPLYYLSLKKSSFNDYISLETFEDEDEKALLDDTDNNDDEVIEDIELEKSQLLYDPTGIYEKLFVDDENSVVESYVEETSQDAKVIKSNYIEKIHSPWIQNFMHNSYYGIEKSEDESSQCMFYAIREAFATIGKKTTVEKLRFIISEHVSDDIYLKYKHIYDEHNKEMKLLTTQMNELKKELHMQKEKLELSNDRTMKLKLQEAMKSNIEKLKTLKSKKELVMEIRNEYAYMKQIKSTEQFKSHVQSCEFWGEKWAVSTFEKILNVKFILLSPEAYENEDKDNVIMCSDDSNMDEIEFKPNYYIILDTNGSLYTLIKYRNKGAFTYSELPYDLKKLIVVKCLENSNSSFSRIPDFKGQIHKYKPSNDLINVKENDVEESQMANYDEEVIFQIYSKSNTKPYPGKGAGESILETKIKDYAQLNNVIDWRKKLDSYWKKPFILDNEKWNSVEHYVQASKFKQYPEVYRKFTFDAQTAIGEDPAVANQAGTKNNYFSKDIKPVKHSDEHALKVVENANYAKFSQHADSLGKILIDTKDAKLTLFKRGKPSETLVSLMKVREKMKK
jgi:predicted NAD-dependent protein-ADP-ribosyltransferase YbiA (DUF1768 family)